MSAITALVLIAGLSQANAADLRSPWDEPVSAHKSETFTCPVPPRLPLSIEAGDYYADPAHSIVDPIRKKAYDQATGSLHAAMRSASEMADRYQAGGGHAEADCAAHFLDGFATSGALTGATATNQAVYVQGWVLGSFAITWLKIRSEQNISTEERVRITTWLADVASKNIAYYGRRDDTSDGRNNHRYWAGLSAMAAGIAASRKDLFDWGVDSFKIGAMQIGPDGTLPLEMKRKSRALHYHIFAAAPLVTMAELAAANGVDLYEINDKGLSRLTRKIVAGIADPSSFTSAAGAQQEPMHLHAEDLAWAAPIERRYPDPALDALLKTLTSRSMLYLGGLPPK
ncbi:poly(beta-D-mannuronate) lyase [Rhizobium sp. P38BS-XIX]|uniref:alginate lyase family protein n=1 Tax=Rhizobium sp. P38BS-XIX TaxID=2726740 RepID=UPI0014563E16|nr:alginate lyase family protein [Rhizobium sp. P38BS-XIX]NLS00542.1 poly(beta-D-mannuronate) lyase [Rhizobium sp. P38BS-XIX]